MEAPRVGRKSDTVTNYILLHFAKYILEKQKKREELLVSLGIVLASSPAAEEAGRRAFKTNTNIWEQDSFNIASMVPNLASKALTPGILLYSLTV